MSDMSGKNGGTCERCRWWERGSGAWGVCRWIEHNRVPEVVRFAAVENADAWSMETRREFGGACPTWEAVRREGRDERQLDLEDWLAETAAMDRAEATA